MSAEQKNPDLAGLDELIRLMDEKISGKVTARRQKKDEKPEVEG